MQERAIYESDVWKVDFADSNGHGKPETQTFEHLIVASGFFGNPKKPKNADGTPIISGNNASVSS